MAIMIGAGNIWRGRQGGSMNRSRADHKPIYITQDSGSTDSGYCGLSHSFFREVALTGIYAICCCSFAMVLRRLLPRLGLLAVVTPLLAIAMLVVCPVFFDVGILRPFQGIFPMGWYLRSSFAGLGIYTLGCFAFCAVFDWRLAALER